VVLLPPRVRRRHLLYRHHERARSTAVDAQPRSSLEVHPRPAPSEAGLRGATPRPVVGESPRNCRAKDVESKEARARPFYEATLAYREGMGVDRQNPRAPVLRVMAGRLLLQRLLHEGHPLLDHPADGVRDPVRPQVGDPDDAAAALAFGEDLDRRVVVREPRRPDDGPKLMLAMRTSCAGARRPTERRARPDVDWEGAAAGRASSRRLTALSPGSPAQSRRDAGGDDRHARS